MVAHVKKHDTVMVISGRDKGLQGTVLEILPKKSKVMVKGLSLITRHAKPRKQGEVGGIKTQESYLRLSQIMPVCPSCRKACRVQIKMLENGKKARMCCYCKESM